MAAACEGCEDVPSASKDFAFGEGFSFSLAFVFALALAFDKVGVFFSALPFSFAFSFGFSVEAGVVVVALGGVSRTFPVGLKASSSSAFSFPSAFACTPQLRPSLKASSDERLVLVDLPEDVLVVFFGYEPFFKGVLVLDPIAELTVKIPRVEDCEGASSGSPVAPESADFPCTLLRKRGSASPVLVAQKSSNTWALVHVFNICVSYVARKACFQKL